MARPRALVVASEYLCRRDGDAGPAVSAAIPFGSLSRVMLNVLAGDIEGFPLVGGEGPRQ